MAQQRPHSSSEKANEPDAAESEEWGALKSDLDEILTDDASGQSAEGQGFLDHIDELRSHLTEGVSGAGADADRRGEPTKSGRQAVERFGERRQSQGAAPGHNPVAESLQAAIDKIRSTQGPRAKSGGGVPASSGPALGDIVEMTARLADRMGQFEQTVSARFDNISDTSVVARQIGLLTETVGQLSQLVKKAGDTTKLESKIAQLLTAETQDPAVVQLSSRMERLNESVRKLADIQVNQVRRGKGKKPGQGEPDMPAGEMMEASIRSIYDKLDAIEKSTPMAPEDMDRLSSGIASLAAAMDKADQNQAISDELIARIESIGKYVESLEPSEGSSGFTELKDEINTLRRYMVEAFEPRFDALEERIKELSNRMALGAPEGVGQEIVQEQLGLLVAKIDHAGKTLSELSKQQEHNATRSQPDIADLVDIIAAKTAAEVTAQKGPADTIGVSNIAVSALRESIAQVDRRLDNLQDTLKRLAKVQQSGTGSQPASARGTAAAAPRAPEAKASVAPAPSASAPLSSPMDEPAPPPPAYNPPPRGELPPMPVSSLGQNADDIFKRAAEQAATRDAGAQARPPREGGRETSPVSRESFIEAARRAAQRSTEASVLDANGGFLGKALARLKRKSAEEDDEDEDEVAPPPAAKDTEPETPPAADEVIIDEPERHDSEDDEPESFLARHSRPILLAASFVAVGLMALNLIGQRMGPADITTGEAIETANTGTEVPAVDASVEMPIGLEPGEELAPSEIRKVGAVPEDKLPAAGAAQMDLAEAVTQSDEMVTGSINAIPLPTIEAGPAGLRDAAANGDARAQFEVAAIYTEGRAVPQDYAAAALWYGRAALSGFAPAQYRLGNLYENGRGLAKDLDMARQWYLAAAEAGNRMAMHNLAALYAGGQLASQDFASAALWFERAAQLGIKDSQFNLGMLYARGLGVSQDFVQSYKWFALAAIGGDADAATARDDIARSLDAEALRRAQTLADGWRMGTLDIAANYAPIGTWAPEFDPGAEITEQPVVAQVQRLLAKLGYEVGEPDGLFGPKTEIAIRAFEAATGMFETGKINPRLLAVLGGQPV